MKPRQVEVAIIRILNSAISELQDPRVPMIVTIERVSLTQDYSVARVYVSSIGENGPLVEALNNARGRLQHEVGHGLKLRRVPLLEFYPAGASPFDRLPVGDAP
ncbi:ribosome-binding factor A [Deinococcus aquiradiocola]|uniref:Ribosome-binding factor A n=1 Tax=Deinococcus aquiradiocola TaxID=393059 RepID=A0A917PE60_9DEIO|nr:ribosome-binding factor A [Deinococcus aquiradiocola]GGJ72277.1 ribosome-binding factor A [Deinococcus aquiradiocola]